MGVLRASSCFVLAVLVACGSGDDDAGPPPAGTDAGASDAPASMADAAREAMVDSGQVDAGVDTGGCPAAGTNLGDGCGKLLDARCDAAKKDVLLCGKVDGCLVWTTGAACVTGQACQDTAPGAATCCIGPGQQPGFACPSNGATACEANGKELTCAPDANAAGCLIWSETTCAAPKSCPASASQCTCPAPGTNPGDGCTPNALECQPGGKIYDCGTSGGCNVWTLQQTCPSGACGNQGTCCPALGATPGTGCPTEGGTQCSGQTVMTCARGVDGCLLWQATTTCTSPLQCGGAPAACECARHFGTTWHVNPNNAIAAQRPTGTTDPGCSFARISDATAVAASTDTVIAEGATVEAEWLPSNAYAAAARVSPVWSNGHAYAAQGAGTSGATEPAWCTAAGCTVTDGTVTWKESGAASAIDFTNETFPIVVKGFMLISAGCAIGQTSCRPNGYVIRFNGANVPAAVQVAAIGNTPYFRGFRVTNDSATPADEAILATNGSVTLQFLEAFGHSDTTATRMQHGFASNGGTGLIYGSVARDFASDGASLSAPQIGWSILSSSFVRNGGAGLMLLSNSFQVSDTVVTDNAGDGVHLVGTSLALTRGRVASNGGDGLRVENGAGVTTVSVDGTQIDHNGGHGMEIDSGQATIANASIFRNAGAAGVFFPSEAANGAKLAGFTNDRVYCNAGAQIELAMLASPPYDLSGGDSACGSPNAANLVYGYGGANPGTIGVKVDATDTNGANASFMSWASGASAPADGVDFSGLTPSQASSAATTFCAIALPACPP